MKLYLVFKSLCSNVLHGFKIDQYIFQSCWVVSCCSLHTRYLQIQHNIFKPDETMNFVSITFIGQLLNEVQKLQHMIYFSRKCTLFN